MLGFSFPELAIRRTQTGGAGGPVNLTFGAGLPAGVTITRASAATYVDVSGAIQEVPANTARFDHDPVSHAPLGLLVEQSTSNLVRHARAQIPGWSNLLCTTTQLSLNELGIFPGLQAASGGEFWHRVNVATDGWTSGTAYRVKVWYKAGSSGQVLVIMRNLTAGVESAVGGATGALGITGSGAGPITQLQSTALGNGVHMLELTLTPTSDAAAGQVGVGPYSATAGEDITVLGAQFEANPAATSFINNGGTVVPRASDGIVLQNWTGTYDITIGFHGGGSETRNGVAVTPGYVLNGLSQRHVQSITLS